jgi:hypothetical protein
MGVLTMKINNKSLPVYVNAKELKQKLQKENTEFPSYAHDISFENNVTITMELNYDTLKWDCVAEYFNGSKFKNELITV